MFADFAHFSLAICASFVSTHRALLACSYTRIAQSLVRGEVKNVMTCFVVLFYCYSSVVLLFCSHMLFCCSALSFCSSVVQLFCCSVSFLTNNSDEDTSNSQDDDAKTRQVSGDASPVWEEGFPRAADRGLPLLFALRLVICPNHLLILKILQIPQERQLSLFKAGK